MAYEYEAASQAAAMGSLTPNDFPISRAPPIHEPKEKNYRALVRNMPDRRYLDLKVFSPVYYCLRVNMLQ